MSMPDDLDAVRDAWDKTTGDGRDASKARELSDAYVAAHPDEFVSLRDKTIEECVAAVDVFRAAGMETEQWRVEAWLLHRYAPQNIGGAAEAQLRIPGSA